MICRGIMVKPQLMNDPHANEAADDIIALLELCQQLQSAKDGIERPVPGAYSRDEDEFADRIRAAYGHVLQLRRLLPVMATLSAIGIEMERRGEFSVMTGDDYSRKALEYLMAKYLPKNGDAA